MGIDKVQSGWDKHGQPIYFFTICNKNGALLRLCSMGAAIQALLVPDREGKLTDIIPGYDTGTEYCGNAPHFGAMIGRCCNRIRGASFQLDGRQHFLSINSGKNHIHGGVQGFDHTNWNGRIVDENTVAFDAVFPDGMDGYPGNLQVTVQYTWNDRNQMTLMHRAVCDKTTIYNPTSHTYFNLNGQGRDSVLNHLVQLSSRNRLELDAEFLPTGQILPVEGTQYDLWASRALSFDGIASSPTSGCYLLEPEAPIAATVVSPRTGIRMDVRTDLPFLVFYTGYAVKPGNEGKNGVQYGPYCGLCVETSHPIDAIHHPHLDQFILPANTPKEQWTEFSFCVQ